MAIREPKIQRDGIVSTLGGVDSGRSESLLDPGVLSFAGNCVMRGGFAQGRPGFFQVPLSFPTDEMAAWFDEHTIQGAKIFQPRDPSALEVVSVGGRIFTRDEAAGNAIAEITPTKLTTTIAAFVAPAVGASVAVAVLDATFIRAGYPLMIAGSTYQIDSLSGNVLTVTNVNATPGAVASGVTVVHLDVNSPDIGRVWMEHAEIFLIIQDGLSRAIIFDGSKTFRSDITKQQVPTGTAMAYGRGRLWVAIREDEFVAGDIVRGEKHEPEYDGTDALLYFTENTYLAGGGSFHVPLDAGPITAMRFMPVLDTSTGNGPLLVFTEKSAFSVDAPADRLSWGELRSPIQTVVLIGAGAVSQDATVTTTNSDIFFRAPDGMRSFILAIREFQGSWGNTPISTEVDRAIRYDDETLLRFASAIQFDNRLLFTCVPQPAGGGAHHLGIVSLDFHPISSMRSKSPPIYDGIWTGIKPVLLFKGDINKKERAFCWARNEDGKNELWEISRRKPFDGTQRRIKSFIETRALSGKDPLELKRAAGVELFVADVMGTVDFTLFYRPDQYPCWIEWGRAQSVCAEWRTCPDVDDACGIPVVKRPGYKTRLNFGSPPDVDSEADDKPAKLGYEFQFRLEWEGHCRIRKLVARFAIPDEEVFPTVA